MERAGTLAGMLRVYASWASDVERVRRGLKRAEQDTPAAGVTPMPQQALINTGHMRLWKGLKSSNRTVQKNSKSR